MSKTHIIKSIAPATVEAASAPAPATDKKRNALYECRAMRGPDDRAIGVIWTFKGGEEWKLLLTQLDDKLFAEACAHGVKQKVNDAAAMAKDTSNGKSASDSTKKAAMYAVFERLLNGVWNAPREPGEGSGSLLLRAILKAHPDKSEEKVRDWLKGLSDAQKTALLEKNPAIKAAADAIRAARVSEDVEVPNLDDIPA